jgi:hypothetical protein
VRQGRDQDDRRSNILRLELSDEVEPTHAGHVDIGDDAVKAEPVGVVQQGLRSVKWLGAIPDRSHQIHQGQAQGLVVIDDSDKRDVHRLTPQGGIVIEIQARQDRSARNPAHDRFGNRRHEDRRTTASEQAWLGLPN